jgi:hypothetical protein
VSGLLLLLLILLVVFAIGGGILLSKLLWLLLIRRGSRAHRRAFHRPNGVAIEAEGEGFEPSIRQTTDNGFRDRRIRPLCHPSGAEESVAAGV